ELEAATIGQVTDDGMYRVREDGVVVCEVPGHPLVNGCPTYTREGVEAPEVAELRTWRPDEEVAHGDGVDPADALLRLLASPTIASKRWVWEQYDTTVRTSTVQGPGADAGVIRIRGTSRGIAATTDCNGRYVYLNPRRGAMIAVAEAARNVVCKGARPRAVTNCLNFGNPLKPEIYHQFGEAVRGMAEACRTLGTPVVSGNVSFYNEHPGGAIHPTPTIGMVGVLDDVSKHVRAAFREPGDAIVLLGRNTDELGGSEYLAVVHGRVAGDAPAVDLAAEKALHDAMLELVDRGLVHSAHDCAEGGLAVCIAESAAADPTRPLGAEVVLSDDLRWPAALFGEAQGRIVVSCEGSRVDAVLAAARGHGVPARRIGTVGRAGGRFVVLWVEADDERDGESRIDGAARRDGGAHTVIDAAVTDLAAAYHEAIPRSMAVTPTAVPDPEAAGDDGTAIGSGER
ncbi:MAG: AIR synthase related protein, partial [Gemmatimonadota bacterium]